MRGPAFSAAHCAFLAALLAAPMAGPAAAQTVRDFTGGPRGALPTIGEGGELRPALAPGEEPAPEPAPGEARSLFRTAPKPPEGVEAAPNTWTDPVIERPESRTLPADVAQLRMLDKMSGAAETFEIAVGETAERGRLSIHLSACRAQPPELPPDAFAWLRITDLREEAPRFEGWMIASNPSLSALDHQRYDVWVLSCSTRSAGAASESEKKSASR